MKRFIVIIGVVLSGCATQSYVDKNVSQLHNQLKSYERYYDVKNDKVKKLISDIEYKISNNNDNILINSYRIDEVSSMPEDIHNKVSEIENKIYAQDSNITKILEKLNILGDKLQALEDKSETEITVRHPANKMSKSNVNKTKAITVNAEKLRNDYYTNNVKANMLYKDKPVVVVGYVVSVFDTNDEKRAMVGIGIEVNSCMNSVGAIMSINDAASLNIGEEIKVFCPKGVDGEIQICANDIFGVRGMGPILGRDEGYSNRCVLVE
jgi:hypothetical protein